MDRLSNTIRPYAWGSTTAIPELIGTQPNGEPQAELWMGAHPGAPSLLDRGTRTGSHTDNLSPTPLSEIIAADPEAELSPAAVERFGPSLPFLLKLLAAGKPLSLQVHPDLARARAGFAEEEARGIPIDAPNRNYKDANHKPEMLVALGEFSGLCGFREPHRTAELFDLLNVEALAPWAETLHTKPEAEALREVLTSVLTTEPTAMAATVADTVTALRKRAADPDAPWAEDSAAYAAISEDFPGDPGVIAAMLLNHVRLSAGEAIYLGAGVLHAYLSGLGVEILANSDNVLRCGLTPKHIDVPELLRVVTFPGGPAEILHPETDPRTGEQLYRTPADDFRLSRYELTAQQPAHIPGGTPQILFSTAGDVTLHQADTASMTLRQGESAYAPATDTTEIRATATAPAELFRATISL